MKRIRIFVRAVSVLTCSGDIVVCVTTVSWLRGTRGRVLVRSWDVGWRR